MKFSLDQFSKYFSYGEQLRPARDWMVMIVLALVIAAVSVVWNIWLFYETVSGKQIGATPVATPVQTALPSSDIAGVQDVFKARATEAQNYQKNYKFVDPSVP